MSEDLQPDAVTNLVYQSFARNLTTTLSAHLRYDIGFTLSPAPDPSESVPSTTPCWAVLRVEPGHLPLVIELPSAFAKLIIELLLGGQPGSSDEEETSELTEIEKHLIWEILELFAAELTHAMARTGSWRVHAERIETEAAMLRAFAPGDPLMAINLIAEASETNHPIKIRHAALFDNNAAGEPPSSSKTDAASRGGEFIENLRQVEVDFEARLEGPQLPVQELMALEPGDVLRLRQQTSRPVAGYVNGVTQMKGHIVSAGRRRAFLVEPN